MQPNVQKHNDADQWHDFESEFKQLEAEELSIVHAVRNGPYYLQAICSYGDRPEVLLPKREHGQGPFCLLKAPEYGLWALDGVNENFKERFLTLAARAGAALDCPDNTDPVDFWLHRLFLDLLGNRSKELLAGASKEGGTIRRACVASATFCSRLERKALKTPASTQTVTQDAQTALTAEAPKGFDGLGKKKIDFDLNSANLTDRQHDCLSMRLEYGLRLAEIARRLGLNRSTVQEHLKAAKTRLNHDRNFQLRQKRHAAHGGSHESD